MKMEMNGEKTGGMSTSIRKTGSNVMRWMNRMYGAKRRVGTLPTSPPKATMTKRKAIVSAIDITVATSRTCHSLISRLFPNAFLSLYSHTSRERISQTV